MQDRIEKLLRLANGAATAAERDAALARAAHLAAAGGLDLDAIREAMDATGAPPPPEAWGELERAVLDTWERLPGWRTAMAAVAGRVTGVWVWRARRFDETRIMMAGRSRALASCSALYHAMTMAGDAGAYRAYPSGTPRAYELRNGYRLGFASGVERAHLSAALPGEPMALVIRDAAEERRAEAETYAHGTGLVFRKAPPIRASADGFERGEVDGQRFEKPADRPLLK